MLTTSAAPSLATSSRLYTVSTTWWWEENNSGLLKRIYLKLFELGEIKQDVRRAHVCAFKVKVFHLIQDKRQLCVLPDHHALPDCWNKDSWFNNESGGGGPWWWWCITSDVFLLLHLNTLIRNCHYVPICGTRLLNKDVNILDSVGNPQRLPWSPPCVRVTNQHLVGIVKNHHHH